VTMTMPFGLFTVIPKAAVTANGRQTGSLNIKKAPLDTGGSRAAQMSERYPGSGSCTARPCSQ
jgi:hypothetical protein